METSTHDSTSDQLLVRPQKRYLVACGILLAITAAVGLVSLNQHETLRDTSDSFSEFTDLDAKAFPRASRELLHIRSLLASDPLDTASLELRRSFAAQRINEINGRRVLSLLDDDGVARTDELEQEWTQRVNPAIEMIVASGQLPAPASVNELVADLLELEGQYNRLSDASEIHRRASGFDLSQRIGDALDDSRSSLVAIATVGILLSGFAVGLGIWLVRLTRQLAESRSKLQRADRQIRTLSQVAALTSRMVLVLDDRGQITWANDGFRNRMDFHDEIIGTPFWSLLHCGADGVEGAHATRDRLLDFEDFETEVCSYARDGEAVPVHIEVRSVVDDQGDVENLVVIAADVGDRQRTEEVLRKATDEAEALARSKSNFLATMTHEIRTPLHSIIGVSELLLDTEQTTEQQRYCEVARSAGTHLLEIVNDILSYSALDAGQVDLDIDVFDLDAVVAEAIAILEPSARTQGTTLSYVQADANPGLVEGDATRISHILINLLGNAVKFSPGGHVDVIVGRQGDLTSIRVVDTGIGIGDDDLENLFQPFARLDRPVTGAGGGTGLGLVISRRLAEAMHGTVELTSEVGVGTIATLEVPLRSIHAEEHTAIDTSRKLENALLDDETYPPWVGLRVLLVGDDDVGSEVLSQMLEHLECRHDVVRNGWAGLTAALSGEFDLVLLDVPESTLDSLDVVARLQELEPHRRPALVAVTESLLLGHRRRFIDAGIEEFVAKPVRFASLTALLSRSSQHRMTEL